MEQDGIYLRVLRDLEEALAKVLSTIYYQTWITKEVWDDWRLANVMPALKNG